jgi:ADP-ribose pyrophosphatase
VVSVRPESSEVVYEGDFLSVSVEHWNGHRREIVERPDVVAVVAVDDQGLVWLVRQARPPARRALTELPAGRIEPGEEPLAGGRRELAEETGLTGGNWRHERTFWTTPGFCRERVHLYVAEGLERGPASPMDDEKIELVRVPVGELERVLEEVEDAKTLAGILLYLAART